MLNRRGRIIITVVSLSVLIIILDCIIGFTMGGVFTVKHWLIVIPINALLSLLSILFIKGKEYIKSKKMLEPFIFITVLLVAASCLFMFGLARLGADSQGIQEVSGSIPLISTKQKALKPLYINGFKAFFVSFCKTVLFSYMMSKQRI